jgi:hypothetical protein
MLRVSKFARFVEDLGEAVGEPIRVGVLQFFIPARFVNLAVSPLQYQFADHRFVKRTFMLWLSRHARDSASQVFCHKLIPTQASAGRLADRRTARMGPCYRSSHSLG